MAKSFNPIAGRKGEFRISLNLTELGDRAWDILALSQTLEFGAPKFRTSPSFSGAVEVWAIICEEMHKYDADTYLILQRWDDKIDQLRNAIGQDEHLSLIVLCNFAEYIEPTEVYA
jgi:hypothetical protein